jgi:AcrR family transcriptional regulator
MIRSAALLMRERGVDATSFSDVIAASGAPRGSIYHHFPGGKTQLIEEATRYAGDFIASGIAEAHQKYDPVTSLQRSARFWRNVLDGSSFAAGCPVVAATVEAARTPAVLAAAADAFARWQELFAANLAHHGIAEERAASLAALVISALEGAIVLCRAQQSTAPLDRVTEELSALLRAVLPDSA